MSSILPLVTTFGPTLAKTLGLAALAGTASEGASLKVKKISGGGQKVGFIVPHSKTDKVEAYLQSLTEKPKKDLLNALRTGSDFTIPPTAQQVGSGLGTILASISIPILLNALTGKGRVEPHLALVSMDHQLGDLPFAWVGISRRRTLAIGQRRVEVKF